MGLALTNSNIDKYFRFLTKLDNTSKKRLIMKLTESMEKDNSKDFDLNSLHGAWEDSRSSDEIIKEIRESRKDKQNDINF